MSRGKRTHASTDPDSEEREQGWETCTMEQLRSTPYNWPMDQGLLGMFEMPLFPGSLGTELFHCTEDGLWVVQFRTSSAQEYRPDGVALADLVARLRDCILLNPEDPRGDTLVQLARCANQMHDALELFDDELPLYRSFALPDHGHIKWNVPLCTWTLKFPTLWDPVGCSVKDVLQVIAQVVRHRFPGDMALTFFDKVSSLSEFTPLPSGGGGEGTISFDLPAWALSEEPTVAKRKPAKKKKKKVPRKK